MIQKATLFLLHWGFPFGRRQIFWHLFRYEPLTITALIAGLSIFANVRMVSSKQPIFISGTELSKQVG